MNEQLVVADHRDVQACALCIDPHGDYAALAGRRVLAVLELEDISVVLRRVARGSKWDVSTGGTCLWTPREGRYQHTIALSVYYCAGASPRFFSGV